MTAGMAAEGRVAARSPVDVAVGILIRPDGRLLLASRPAGKPYAGYWEFPGGKLEPGETVARALARELHEELGVDIGPVFPWLVRVFEYPHALVRLHFCRVFEWSGDLHAREQQRFGFHSLDALPTPLLPATVPVLRGLELPGVYALSAAHVLGVDEFLRRLDAALSGGLRFVQLREPELAVDDAERLLTEMRTMTQAAGARLLVNSRHHRGLWERADGVHLTSRDLLEARERPALPWVGASVHDVAELEHAGALGLDYAVLGAVEATTSHPGRAPLGWTEFERIARATALPIYAIGGLTLDSLPLAMACGAHGVALLSAAWRTGQCFEGDSAGGVSSASSAGPPGTT
ncbi:MAG: Nudix family hydrolase [Burkholderiaceae bacterium]